MAEEKKQMQLGYVADLEKANKELSKTTEEALDLKD